MNAKIASPRLRRSPLVRCAAAAAGALMLAACGSGAADTKASDTNAASDTLVVVTPDTSLVWTKDFRGFGGDEALNNTGATLLRKPYIKSSTSDSYQQDVNKFEPYLASSYQVSPDGLTYTFALRDAISAAGNHLTVDDVLWSYERKFATPTSPTPGVSAPVITDPARQFKKIDAHTFTITIARKGYGLTLLALLADLTAQIYDSTLLKAHVSASDPYAVAWSENNPNFGFGPYTVKSFQPGVQAVLTAYDKFVLGPPAIKNIILKVIPDAGTRANTVRNGDASVAEAVLPADLVTLKQGKDTKIATVDDPNARVTLPLVTNKAPFNNILIRQAFAWAVPYQQIVDNVYHGLAIRRGSGLLRQDAPGYDGSGLTDFAFNPAKAKELLAQAGMPNGVSFTLTVSASEPDMQEAAIQIQTFAKQAGFDITITKVPAAQMATGRDTHTFQSFITRDSAFVLTPSYELAVYTSPTGGNNIADWKDPRFQAALAAGNAADNPVSPAAGKLWNSAERILVNDAPIVFVAQIQPGVAMRSNVQGYAWRSDQTIDFSRMSFG
jgi:peptide/nickel transport system substrate-binding protein